MIRRIPFALPILALAMMFSAPASASPTDVNMGEPYQTEINTIFDDAPTSMNLPVSDVPAGKRLVIRSVSGVIYGPLGEYYKIILLTKVGAGAVLWHPLDTRGESFNDPEAKAHATIFSVDTYINASRDEVGRIMRVSIVRSLTGHPTFVRLTISGYLVDEVLRTVSTDALITQ